MKETSEETVNEENYNREVLDDFAVLDVPRN